MSKERILMSSVTGDAIDAQILLDKMPNSNVGMFIPYGIHNDYPNYLNDLVLNCAVLNSIINSFVDYALGTDYQFNAAIRTQLNGNRGPLLKKLLRKVAYDKIVTGAFAVKLIFNRQKEIAEMQWLDIRNVRLNYDMNKAYYSETFGKGRRGEIEVYSTFEYFEPGEDENNPYACIYYDNGDARGIYAVPVYSGALRSIETAIQISKFHLSSIQNNLSASAIINIPGSESYSEEEKRDIERKFHLNFTGADNGSSFMLAFCDNKDNAVTIEKLSDEGFDKKYENLSKDTIKNIFTAFRMTPQLAGFLQDNIGFNQQEFSESFNLFNMTVIKPFLNQIINAFNYMFNTLDSIEITPFKINTVE